MTEPTVMRILLAIDGSPCSTAATDALIAHTRPADTDVRVLHVVEWPAGGPSYLYFGVGSAAIQGVLDLRQRAMEKATGLVDEVVARLRGAGFNAHGLVQAGDARSVIVETAAARPADLILMGSHGRRGFNRMTLGSVAESVMHRAACSVTIVRSHGHAAGDQPSASHAQTAGAQPSASPASIPV